VSRAVEKTKLKELGKLDQRRLVLPPCVGKPEVDVIEDPESFLDVVSEHRVPPFDIVSLPTMFILEGHVYGPKYANNGPGTTAMLKQRATNPHFKRRLQVATSGHKRVLQKDDNPLGNVVPFAGLTVLASSRSAPQLNTRPTTGLSASTQFPGQACVRPSTGMSASSQSLSTDGFPRLPNISLGARPETTQFLTESNMPNLAIGQIGQAIANAEMGNCLGMAATQSMSASPSLPSLLQPQGVSGQAREGWVIGAQSNISADVGMSNSSICQSGANTGVQSLPRKLRPMSNTTITTTFTSRSSSTFSMASKRQQHISNAFVKAMTGKSILIFSDNVDLRKLMTHLLLSDDVKLTFIKTSNDLWMRFKEPKEHYDTLLLDLAKRDMQTAVVLQTIRQDNRYGLLPIVALSEKGALPDIVRQRCNYVVYLPLSVPVLKEALIWCLDRRCSEKHAKPVVDACRSTADYIWSDSAVGYVPVPVL